MQQILFYALETFNYPTAILDSDYKIVSCNMSFIKKIASKRSLVDAIQRNPDSMSISNRLFKIHIKELPQDLIFVQISNLSSSSYKSIGITTDIGLDIIEAHDTNGPIELSKPLSDYIPNSIFHTIPKLKPNVNYAKHMWELVDDRYIHSVWKIRKSTHTYSFTSYSGGFHESLRSDRDILNFSEIIDALGIGFSGHDGSIDGYPLIEANKTNMKQFNSDYQELSTMPRIFVDERGTRIPMHRTPMVLAHESGLVVENLKMAIWSVNTNDWVWISATSIPVADEIYHIADNITTQMVTGDNPFYSDVYFKTLLGALPIGVGIMEGSKVIYSNPVLKSYTTNGRGYIELSDYIKSTTNGNEITIQNDNGDDRIIRFDRVSIHDGKSLGLFTDITELKSMYNELLQYKNNLEELILERNRELAEAKELYHTISNEVPVGVWMADKTGHIRFMNPLYEEISGKDENIFNIFDSEEDMKKFKHAMEHEKKYEMVFQKTIDCKVRWIRIKFYQTDSWFLGITDDMTNEYLTINKLKDLKKEFEDIFDDVKRGDTL